MPKLFELAISPLVLPVTICLGLALLYWVMVIIGALDLSFLDADIDTDIDADIDVDVDANIEADVSAEGGAIDGAAASAGIFASALSFFHVGYIPVMILYSLFILILWTFSILFQMHLSNINFSIKILAVVFLPLASAFLTKIITYPAKKKVLEALIKEKANQKIIGQLGVLDFKLKENALSQIRITTEGSPHVINIKSRSDETLPKGQQVLVIEKDKEKDFYWVEKFEDWS